MNTYAIICTRGPHLTETTKKLAHKLGENEVQVVFLMDQTSIFVAYEEGVAACGASKDDIVILCHDDIELTDTKDKFHQTLSILSEPSTGILGPAGAAYLGPRAVWWDRAVMEQGLLKGSVKHRLDGKVRNSVFGSTGQVVVLDGLFLAATKEVWDRVGLSKPEYFEGDWDFYDIQYTSTAHNLGYKNIAVDLGIIHESAGNPREMWHKNREAFIANTKLPLSLLS